MKTSLMSPKTVEPKISCFHSVSPLTDPLDLLKVGLTVAPLVILHPYICVVFLNLPNVRLLSACDPVA